MQIVKNTEDKASGRIRIGSIEFDFDRNIIDGPDGEIRIEPKLALLLWVLVQNAGSVIDREQLIEQVWDGAYGADQSLTNAISQLRKTLGEENGGTNIIETVPKRGYRLVARVTDIPSTDGSSPKGSNTQREQPTVSANPSSLFARVLASESFLKRIPLLALCALIVVVLIAISTRSTPDKKDNEGSTDIFAAINPASIAVLPFSNLSEDESQEFFSDGISEEILNALSDIKGLRVTSRTSSFTFRNSDTLRIPEIAHLLGVQYILEGSVRESGSMVRVTAQLIDASSDQQLWSRTFDNELSTDNIFTIQYQIATAIVEQLGLKADPTFSDTKRWVESKTDDLGAYQAFLKGREKFTSGRTTASTREGIEYYERAFELDPTFALALAHLAGAYQIAPSWLLFDQDYHALAKQAAEQAAVLDPNLALPLGILGLGEIESQPANYANAFKYFDEAFEKEPGHTSILIWRGIAHVATGFFDLGRMDFEACLDRDPANDSCRNWLALAHLFSEQYDVAFELFEQSAANGSRTHLGIFAKAYAAQGDERAALLTWAWDFNGSAVNTNRFYRAHTDPAFNFDLEARAYEIEHENEHGRKPNWGQAGALDATHTFKKYAMYEPYWWYPVWWLRMHEDFITSPHRKRLIREHGIYDYWRQHGFPPQCRPITDDDFECD